MNRYDEFKQAAQMIIGASSWSDASWVVCHAES